MQHTILTVSRGDAPRLKEWVDYHCWLGLDTFHIILDNPVDDSEHIIRRLKVPARLIVDVRGAVGDYYDGLSRTERWG